MTKALIQLNCEIMTAERRFARDYPTPEAVRMRTWLAQHLGEFPGPRPKIERARLVAEYIKAHERELPSARIRREAFGV